MLEPPHLIVNVYARDTSAGLIPIAAGAGSRDAIAPSGRRGRFSPASNRLLRDAVPVFHNVQGRLSESGFRYR